MAEQALEKEIIYRVVVNHEEQYSIWPDGKDYPLGWSYAGKTGTKAECLAYIEEVWTDMRPLSLRLKMQKLADSPATPEAARDEVRAVDPRDDLVTYLSQGDHPVQVIANSAEHFVERIKSEYVKIKFTDTRGGTELGIKLDAGMADALATDIAGPNGKLHITGGLTLDYRRVRLVADIALDTLKGIGRLEPIRD